MKVASVVKRKSLKWVEKKNILVKETVSKNIVFSDYMEAAFSLTDNQMTVALDALEEISNKGLLHLNYEFFNLAAKYVKSKDDHCNKVASKIIGNIAYEYQDDLNEVISDLIANSSSESELTRLGSAYALSKIVLLDKYKDTDLVETIRSINSFEEKDTIKEYYTKALKELY